MSAAAMLESEWQQQVIDLCNALQWKHCHVRKTIGRKGRWTTATSVVGWPDLVLWHEGQQRLVFVELKTDTGIVSAEQAVVLASLRAAGQEAYVCRPADLDALHRTLKGSA